MLKLGEVKNLIINFKISTVQISIIIITQKFIQKY